jgi:hypothetical protein
MIDFLPFLLLIIILGSLSFLLFLARSRKDYMTIQFNELYAKIKDDIKFAVAPNFIKLSQGMNDFVDLAVEVWRMEQRVGKSASSLPEQQLKGLENSIQKLKRYLEKYDIEIVDYKNVKYNDGLNLEILNVEKDITIQESLIKETVEPTIMYKGQVVRKAKIILLSNH